MTLVCEYVMFRGNHMRDCVARVLPFRAADRQSHWLPERSHPVGLGGWICQLHLAPANGDLLGQFSWKLRGII